ncbi:MAG: hypothetical protein AVDCRST_MAG68-1771 [uncultured Gemmatimonadetes bacterium]|uniref:Uncharacterized protein n=1 Tax=uncultured Gemmatimonadota bacterium TaxID=203437 RepID=A0A6J4K3Q0_9BACT|nr:MAG: hypothetical protein AVDCRST_MAG68-1771 [uncultured Gemmatimonadota bacterium]
MAVSPSGPGAAWKPASPALSKVAPFARWLGLRERARSELHISPFIPNTTDWDAK